MLLTVVEPQLESTTTMTRLDDDGACAWGRWRITCALNEPVLGGEHSACALTVAPRDRSTAADGPAARCAPARRAPRLRLVTDARPPDGDAERDR
jgi:hypothetical protein